MNVSTYSFRAARLSNAQLVFSFPYTVTSNLSITFDEPIEHLKLYLIGMRAVDLRFNHSFGIAEGATRVEDVSTTSENQISVQGGGRADAIIEFTEPVTTLIFTPISVPGSGYQGITFVSGGDSLLGVDDVYTNANNLKKDSDIT